MDGADAVVVMARFPEVGRVKTRLAARIGAANACAVYSAFLADLGARLAGQRLVWAHTPDDADFASIIDTTAERLPQGEGSLGERMARVFKRLLDPAGDFGCARVVMLGADVPHVPEGWLQAAFAALDSVDVALGPADDGGYYLVAMRRPHDIFSGVPMGTAEVWDRTVERIVALGLAYEALPVLFDLDRVEDLERLPRFLAEHPDVRLERTMTILEQERVTRWKSC